jgi:23S rRNA pseudouridine1911/1915/1917 synthase
MKTTTKRTTKRVGQVRNERPTKGGNSSAKTKRNETGERIERINGAPVYTAIYKVQRSDTLLEFLLRKCNTSRNNVKALLVRKQVLVNGSVVTQYDFPLAKDDEVKLSKKPVKDGTTVIKPTEKAKSPRPRVRLTVIYEDDDFIAIDKPAGLLSVESDKETECAYGYLLQAMQEENKNARPFVLHRIDKETSGVLVFAKNIKIHSMLKMHWNELVQTREYFAVVEGILEEKSGTITNYLKENVNNVVYATNDPTGQKAVTHFEVAREHAHSLYSLLKVKIDTGRKNQIRVHLKDMDHPIIGDDKYGKKQDGTWVKNPIERLGLHASKLEFIHPVTKEIIAISASLPPSFRNLFN